MAGNSFGQVFRITTCGESHGQCVAVIIDGCPANFKISIDDLQIELNRRRVGQSDLVSQRNELDEVEILSGVFEGKTTGTPILLMIKNHNAKSQDYAQLKDIYRPSHADFTYQKKYGIRDYRGGGRASARETVARVAAGAIAKKYLYDVLGIEILSYVEQIGSIKANIDSKLVTKELIESNKVRCPDNVISVQMEALIKDVMQAGDSLGGIISCIIKNVPIGLGEPVFDKLNADLAKAMLSINAVKGFEIGNGFASVLLLGSENNDILVNTNEKIITKTNHAGGIVGGISNGENIFFRLAFKPVSSIKKNQVSVNMRHEEINYQVSGRHDACVLPRAVPIVDAMAALVLLDHYLRFQSYQQ